MRAERWEPVDGIDGHCDDIEFTYRSDNTATVSMHFAETGTARTLTLKFTYVVVLAGENEAPGGFIPAPTVQSLPKLERGRYPTWTFPLLTLLDSDPLKQYQSMCGARLRLRHFFLISSDNLVHVIASADVDAAWG
jgi:hypothetical protein